MVLLKSRIGPLPKPCGKCAWFCLECGRVWDCFEEGGCRGDRLMYLSGLLDSFSGVSSMTDDEQTILKAYLMRVRESQIASV